MGALSGIVLNGSLPLHHYDKCRPSLSYFESKLQQKHVDGYRGNFIPFRTGLKKIQSLAKVKSQWSIQTQLDFSLQFALKRRLNVICCAYPLDASDTISEECERENQIKRFDGKPGFVSFYGDTRGAKEVKQNFNVNETSSRSLIWLLGPLALVASVVLPPFFLRKLFETYFEDSLLTDFLILFFTEALFYSGVAIFLLVVHYLQKPLLQRAAKQHNFSRTLLGYRVVSIGTLVVSVLLPLVSLGLVWPWTGPAASAAVAPYLVGLIVQFAFEQFVQCKKSPVWPIVPAIFQVYRLHQLNRATQLIAGLMFSLRGAETTPQTLAINGSLQTLLNVLQVLGIICLWSMATFMTRLFPSTPEAVSR
eukprot:TRINITY_DN13405_c0_g1_i1.p1 TRINITY_DN13405_c0_g1~~TRINITY_DN13405_c0_g1_i1.p1  ORF type:complete len:364 (-),score=53.02 TRINITY_DN13405_c0_g1_i1:294-1385(-)